MKTKNDLISLNKYFNLHCGEIELITRKKQKSYINLKKRGNAEFSLPTAIAKYSISGYFQEIRTNKATWIS